MDNQRKKKQTGRSPKPRGKKITRAIRRAEERRGEGERKDHCRSERGKNAPAARGRPPAKRKDGPRKTVPCLPAQKNFTAARGPRGKPPFHKAKVKYLTKRIAVKKRMVLKPRASTTRETASTQEEGSSSGKNCLPATATTSLIKLLSHPFSFLAALFARDSLFGNSPFQKGERGEGTHRWEPSPAKRGRGKFRLPLQQTGLQRTFKRKREAY